MSRQQKAVHLLRQGRSPAEIAEHLGVSVRSVIRYLYNQVGEGKILRSEILFSIGEVVRLAMQNAELRLTNLAFKAGVEQGPGDFEWREFRRALRGCPVRLTGDQVAEAQLYFNLRKPEAFREDVYWYIYTIERCLHREVKNVLVKAHDDNWWYSGVPENIRIDCQMARERDPDKMDVARAILAQERDPDKVEEAYCYTTLIHLKEIIDRRWVLFSQCLPKAAASNKGNFLAGLTKINVLRNRVMHAAAKGVIVTEEEFRSLRDFLRSSDLLLWKTEPAATGLIEANVTSPIQ